MTARIVTGLVLTAVVVTTILAGPQLLIAGLVAVAVLLALWEFLSLPGPIMKRTDRVAGTAAGFVLLAATALPPVVGLDDPLLLVKTLAACILVLLLVILFSPHPMEQAGRRAAHLLSGLVYVGLLGCFPILIAGHPDHGREALLVVGVVTWLSDTFAFFCGKAFGRHKLYVSVSPKKTWEGAIGGLAGSVLGSLAIRFLLWPEADLAGLIGFAVVGGALGQTGDLVESVFKRSCGIKDSGTLLPGHGGLLDRIDAFLFVAPLGWLWFVA